MLVRFETKPPGDKPAARILNRATLEGWGLYVLDWLPRMTWIENPYAKDREFRSAAAYSLTVEAARLLACIELHHEHIPTQEAADSFARRTGFDPESALLEVHRALHDPLHGIGYLGYLELKRNEQQLAATSAPEIALLTMVRFTLRTPHLRPVDMRKNMFPFVR